MEYFDVLDENGNKTGEIVERNEAHRLGICHRLVQVWVMNSKSELLMQKRSRNKDFGANMWYVSLGGHIESNESNEQTIEREFFEELGLDVDMEKVQYLYTFKEVTAYKNPAAIDNEFYDVYLLRMDLNPDDLVLQEDEVEEVKFISYNDFKLAVQNRDDSFWIHEEGFSLLFKCLDEYIRASA